MVKNIEKALQVVSKLVPREKANPKRPQLQIKLARGFEDQTPNADAELKVFGDHSPDQLAQALQPSA